MFANPIRRLHIPFHTPSVFLLGMLGMVFQAAFLREMLATFRGGELTVGIALLTWLLWTALGSAVFGRAAECFRRPESWFHLLFPLYAVLGLLGVKLTGAAPALFHLVPGEAVSYDQQVLVVTFAMLPFSMLGGFLFVLGARMLAKSGVRHAGCAYTVEAFGAAFGGLAFSAALYLSLPIRLLITAIPAAIILLSAVRLHSLGIPRHIPLLLLWIISFALVSRLTDPAGEQVEGGLELLEEVETRYSRLRTTRNGEQVTFYADASLLFTVPNPEESEHDAHIPLLATLHPRSVLVLGGGASGIVSETLKHSSVERVVAVELDPEVFTLSKRYLSGTGLGDPRVETVVADGRAFLARSRERFDAVVMHIPEPLSGQANRYHTREFFQLAAERLTPGGVLGFRLSGAENYIPVDLARFLVSVRGALEYAFPSVTVLPGTEVRFLASNEPGAFDSLSWEMLECRRKERGIETFFVRDYYLRYALTPERITGLRDALGAVAETPANSDLRPFGYFLRTLQQGKQDGSRVVRLVGGLASTKTVGLFAVSLLAVLMALALIPGRGARPRMVTASVLAVGMTEISLETLSIMMYQSFFGFLYGRIALLTGAYMAGLAYGGMIGSRLVDGKKADMRTIALIQGGIALIALAWTGLFAFGPAAGPGDIVQAGFFVFTALAGLLGGMQFPLADALFRRSCPADPGGGVVYGMDLAGSAAGALLMASLVFPVLGVIPALGFLVLMNLAVAGIMASGAGR